MKPASSYIKMVTTAKDHECYICKRVIPKGSKAWYSQQAPWDHWWAEPDGDGGWTGGRERVSHWEWQWQCVNCYMLEEGYLYEQPDHIEDYSYGDF